MENEVVVLLPVEFYSEHGVVVQLEKVMAALAVHGIKYERRSDPPRVSLRDGVNTIKELSGDYDFEALKETQQQNEQQNIPEIIPERKIPSRGRKRTYATCVLIGCNGKHVALGLCRKHYDNARRDDPEQMKKFKEAGKRFTARRKAEKNK